MPLHIEATEQFATNYVVISKKDIRRIKALAKKLGFLNELQGLKIKVRPLDVVAG